MYYKQIILSIILGLLVLSGCSRNEVTPNTPTAPVEVVKTYMEEIVEKYGDTYQHLKWLDEEGKTLNLNGSIYDITDEKAAYGDLWMFAVDISKEDVESTFEYLVQLEVEEEKMSGEPFPGGLNNPKSNKFPLAGIYRPLAETFVKTNDEVLSKYSRYYQQRFDGEYDVKIQDSFNSNESSEAIGNDNKDMIPFVDKNWYIRDYILRFGIYLNYYSEIGEEPTFFFVTE